MNLMKMDSLLSDRVYYGNEKDQGKTYLNYSVTENHYWLTIPITIISAAVFENYKSILH